MAFPLTQVIARLLAMIWLALLVSSAASAEADGPDFYRVTEVAKNDTLNIRSAPNPHADKVGEIPPDGNCIRNLGCQGGLSFREFSELSPAEREQRLKKNPRWCKVEYQGVVGWVAGAYLAEGVCHQVSDESFTEGQPLKTGDK